MLLKQSPYIIPCDFLEEVAGFADERVKEEFFAFLQFKNFFFYCSFGDEFVHIYGVFLPDAVGAVDRLIFHARIPPRIEDDYIIRRRKCQSCPASFQAD